MNSGSGWKEINSFSAKKEGEIEEKEWVKDYSEEGPYNKICLHRFSGKVKSGKIILCLPGTWSSGEQLIHLSYHGMGYASTSQEKSRYKYLASRGHIIYALDYRTHFVPPFLKNKELSFMREWGLEKWFRDITESISFILDLENAETLLLEGDSFGGIAAFNYASRYSDENLSGLILMDGGPIKTESWELIYPGTPKSVEEMDGKGVFSLDCPGGINNPIWPFALKNPDVPSPVSGFKNLAEYLMHNLDATNFTNFKSYPFSKMEYIFPILATFDPFWPCRIAIDLKDEELSSLNRDIKLPSIFFTSGNFGTALWDESSLPRGTKKVMLDGYGHLDIYAGENTFKDVFSVLGKWIDNGK